MTNDDTPENAEVLRWARGIYIKRFAADANSARSERLEMIMEMIGERQESPSEIERDIAMLADLGMMDVLLSVMAERDKEGLE